MPDLNLHSRATGALLVAAACAPSNTRAVFVAAVRSLLGTNGLDSRDGLNPEDLTERIAVTDPAHTFAIAAPLAVLWHSAETGEERRRDVERIGDIGITVNPVVADFADVLAALLRGDQPDPFSPAIAAALQRIQKIGADAVQADAATQAEPYPIILGALAGALYGRMVLESVATLPDDTELLINAAHTLTDIGERGMSGSMARVLDDMELRPANPDYGRRMSMAERIEQETQLAAQSGLSPYSFQKPDMPRPMTPDEYDQWLKEGRPGAISATNTDEGDDEGQGVISFR